MAAEEAMIDWRGPQRAPGARPAYSRADLVTPNAPSPPEADCALDCTGQVKPAAPAAGELAALIWEQSVREHARMLYRVAYSVLRQPADAEDAVQEALARAWRYRNRLPAVENPAAWLARIVWRLAVARRPRRQTVQLDDAKAQRHLTDRGATAEKQAGDRQMSELVELLVRGLPGKLRRPLMLSTVDDLSAREVGLVLGISETLVRTRVARARQTLKSKLEAVLARTPEKRNAAN